MEAYLKNMPFTEKDTVIWLDALPNTFPGDLDVVWAQFTIYDCSRFRFQFLNLLFRIFCAL